jgi:hypothetical protein
MVFVVDTVAMWQVYLEVTEFPLVSCHSTIAFFIDHPGYGQFMAAAQAR